MSFILNPYKFKESPAFTIIVKSDNAGTSASNQFTIPVIGAGFNYNVSTSDGYSASGITGNTTITFPSGAGTHTVTISGDFPRIYFNNGGDRLKILDITNWGNMVWASFDNAFRGCNNLQLSATDNPILTSVTNMAGMFRSCTVMNGDISGWDVSNVTTMTDMFREATAFNQNIGGWNVSNVTSMLRMFLSATSFNQNISSWNVGSVTNISGMFRSATAFNQNIGGWNVGSVTNMSEMFYSATAFNQNIGGWDVSNVSNFTDFMFGKTAANYSATNLDAIYNGWSLLSVKPNININFNTIKYTSASSAGRAVLVASPNNWTINDGGI